MSAKIEIYSLPLCGYCVEAKRLLDDMKVHYEEINIQRDPVGLAMFRDRTHGARTVPQIFINDEHIGGYTELAEMKLSGELNKKLMEDAKNDSTMATEKDVSVETGKD